MKFLRIKKIKNNVIIITPFYFYDAVGDVIYKTTMVELFDEKTQKSKIKIKFYKKGGVKR